MRTTTTLAIILFFMVFISCRKEENNTSAETSVASAQKGSFNQFILPVFSKDCSSAGCHVGGTKLIPLITHEQVQKAVNSGLIWERLFSTKEPNICRNINMSSLKLLKVWYQHGGRLE